MGIQRELNISLTGKDSHKVKIPRGQGSLSIGTKGISKGKYDVWVEKDDIINWDAFNELYTGYGEEHKDQYPYGDWPRFFYYSGEDTGFINWSLKREIEEFHWNVHKELNIDLKEANIHRLYIYNHSKVQLSIGNQINYLSLSGYLDNIDMKECIKIPVLSFTFDHTLNDYFQLPFYDTLKKMSFVNIYNSPQNKPFDCRSLLQYPYLTSIELRGHMIHLEALSKLKHLKHIALRYVPDLDDMPSLLCWKDLRSFIGYNIEEIEGKRLRKELKEISKKREMSYSGVTKLRKKIWFNSEYGLLFSGWNEKNAKIASKAYKKCYKEIKRLKTEEEIKQSIIRFIQVINSLDDIETTEREDVGVAVKQLIENSLVDILDEKVEQWYDEYRDF